MRPRREDGFTLIELLVILGVIAVMTAALIGAIFGMGASKEARMSAVRSSVMNIYQECILWRRAEGELDWANLTKQKLIDGDFVKPIAFEPKSNPFGGTYQVAPKSGDAAILEIKVTNVPAEEYSLVDFEETFKRSARSVTLSGGTLTVAF